jgi:uncharacterized membrane protein
MRELIAIGYPDAKAAEAAHDALLTLPREDIFRISEIVVAARDEKGAIKLSHVVHSSALNLRTGTMSGLLIGLLFLHPIFGVLTGAAAGAISEGLSASGVGEDFVKALDDLLRPGQPLLLLERNVDTEHEVDHHIVATLAASGGRLLKTNLDASLEHRLRQALEEARHCAQGEATPAHSANE